MSRTTDILVVGSGMAGLMAAIVASGQGKRVTLLSRGCGSLNIGSGCVDVLGYVNGLPQAKEIRIRSSIWGIPMTISISSRTALSTNFPKTAALSPSTKVIC